MSFKGLKLSIAINFAIPIGIGMLLLNIVGLTLWQRHLQDVVVQQGVARLALLMDAHTLSCGQSDGDVRELLSHQQNIAALDARIHSHGFVGRGGSWLLLNRSARLIVVKGYFVESADNH